MDQMNEEQLKQFLEHMLQINPAMAKFINLQSRHNKLFERSEKSFQKQLNEIDQYTKSMKLLSGDTLGKFTKGIKDSFSNIKEFQQNIQDLDNAIEQAADGAEKHALEIEREKMARRAATVEMQATALDFSRVVSKQVVSALVTATGNFVKGLQNNSSATSLSSGILTGAVDLAGKSASAAGNAVSGVGQALTVFAKGRLKVFGVALDVLGMGASKAADALTQVAKFGIEVLSQEVEKTINSFNSMSSVGALFADGMTGMRTAANGAGLTLEQFSKVVSSNAENLATSGLGVGEASRKLGLVSNELTKNVGSSGKTLRNELLQLGISFEEQTALASEVMADMRRGRSLSINDNRAIAQQTAEYAANLKTIAAITGEDAKTKMQEQRRAATQVAFRLKLQELEQKQPGITQNVLASMSTMDETSRTALMQQLTVGAVVDKSANIMMAGSEAYSNKVTGMAALIESGSFSVEEAQRIQGQANDEMQKDLKNFREIGIAGMVGGLQDLNSAISNQVVNMDQVTQSAVESSRQLVEQQRSTTDSLTSGVMDAANAAQNLKTQLEQVLTPAIAKYATVTATLLDSIDKRVKEFLNYVGSVESKEPKQDLTAKQDEENWGKMSVLEKMESGVARGIEKAGTVADSLFFGAINGALGLFGKTLEDVKKDRIEAETRYLKDKGYAGGGIVSGPADGFLAKLHGTEAIIPLGDSKSVPVSIDFSGFGSVISNMVDHIFSSAKFRESRDTTGSTGGDQTLGNTSAMYNRDNISGKDMSIKVDTSGFNSVINNMFDRGVSQNTRFDPQSNIYSDIAANVGNLTKRNTVIPLDSNRSSQSSSKFDITGIARMLSDVASEVVKTSPAGRIAGSLLNSVTTSEPLMARDNSGELIREQITLLNEIKEILNNSNNLQQQYVYNTYN